jgi:hypothetical protein
MDKNSHEDQTRSDFRHSRFVINSSFVIRHFDRGWISFITGLNEAKPL